jgi:type I restriction enzyme, S subunit
MSKFDFVRIGDIGDVITGKTPDTANRKNYGDDFMFIGPTDLHKHFFIKNADKMISKQGLDSIKSSTLDGISILVGCIGWGMGNVGIVEGKCATNQQINSITNIRKSYNPFYIYYWLKNKKAFLFQQASVTRTPILNKTNFSEIKINIPKDRDVQDRVADLLVSIDIRIDVNNRINAELEAMAKTLYDYWFVQFDFPDENGKPYKSSGGKMTYNATLKREIPAQWDVKKLKEIAFIKKGVLITEKTADTNGNIKVVSAGTDYSYFHSKSNYPENTITVSASGANAGFVNFWREPIFACDCTVVRGKNNNDTETLILLHFLKMRQDYLYQQARGSAQPHVYPKDIEGLKMEIPSDHLAELFGKILLDGNKRIELNLKENQKLAELRDWLLPMLMNGQVTVEGGDNANSKPINLVTDIQRSRFEI